LLLRRVPDNFVPENDSKLRERFLHLKPSENGSHLWGLKNLFPPAVIFCLKVISVKKTLFSNISD